MAWPIIAPAPVVTDHTGVFRDLCDHHCQVRHCQPYVTGLIVLPPTSLASSTRGRLDSADNTTLSRVLSAVPWREEAVNRRRIRYMLQETNPPRHCRREAMVVRDESPVRTRGEPR
jgi:hypothetical protein